LDYVRDYVWWVEVVVAVVAQRRVGWLFSLGIGGSLAGWLAELAREGSDSRAKEGKCPNKFRC